MTPVKSREEDDCLRCSVAALMDLRYEEVPHFLKEASTPSEWMLPVIKFCEKRDFGLAVFDYFDTDKAHAPALINTDVILIGHTKESDHAVVGRASYTLDDDYILTDYETIWNPSFAEIVEVKMILAIWRK